MNKPKHLVNVGDRYSRLQILEILGGRGRKVKCQCDCGNVSTPKASNLVRGITRSCGCLVVEARKKPKRKWDREQLLIPGTRYERLVIIEVIGQKVKCICDCGQTTLVDISNIFRGHTKSCGCLGSELRKKRTKYKTNNIGMRICPKCAVELKISRFSSSAWCRSCVVDNSRNHRKNNKIRHMFLNVKGRAKRSGVPCNIDFSDIIIPKSCPLLGLDLKEPNSGKLSANSPSVDKIIPEKGYVKGNIWIISHRANTLKNNASLDELDLLVTNWKNYMKDKKKMNKYPNSSLHKVPADLSGFFIITVVSNPCRYLRRYELYWRFKRMCEDANVNLITVEQAFGDRRFMVTEPNNPYNLQLRTVEELWHKENMINLGVRHACAQFPGQVKEVAWVDADCRPARMPRDWFEETWHQLQHHEFVQMWEEMIDLDYHFNALGPPMPSFAANYIKYGTPNPGKFHEIESTNERHYPCKSKIFGRPGLAWAANLDSFNKVGGLIDFCILGAGDWYAAHALIGTLGKDTKAEYAAGAYEKKLLEWQVKAQRWIKRDIGYVRGLVLHDFHGKKKNRFYGSRGKILHDCQYDPSTDVKYDAQGLLQLETYDERQIKLRNLIRGYFLSRNEDSIDSE